jgi:transcriptional regulator with XRE-family HTH domain
MTLDELLKSHGIHRPADLKALLGIQRQYAWQLWHGVRQFTPEQALKLFDVYGVPMDELYRAERPPEPIEAPKGRPRKDRGSPGKRGNGRKGRGRRS